MRYFITFSCYGAHLHGDEVGSVDRQHALYGTPTLEPELVRHATARGQMAQAPFVLDGNAAHVVLRALCEVCAHRAWTMIAAHVRATHVHLVVEAETQPERVLNTMKSYSTRALTRIDGNKERRRWARHGSTRWLWTDEDVRGAVHYVVHEQGPAMAVYVGDVP